MLLRSVAIAALAGGAMLALSLSPASAFTLSGPSLSRPIASAQIDKVWWRSGYHWRGYGSRAGYGWRGDHRWGYAHCWRCG